MCITQLEELKQTVDAKTCRLTINKIKAFLNNLGSLGDEIITQIRRIISSEQISLRHVKRLSHSITKRTERTSFHG